MSRQPNLYVETSVWSHLFAEDTPEARRDVEAFFAEGSAGRHEIAISSLVILELKRTKNEEKRNGLLDAVKRHQPRELTITDEATRLALRYVEQGVIPPSAMDDAVHVAVASVASLDVIVSLNMSHIVRVKTRQGIEAINLLENYRRIEIATPGEVLIYGNP